MIGTSLLLATLTSVLDNPVELGRVHWLRRHDQALLRARETGRPVLALFQEVPG